MWLKLLFPVHTWLCVLSALIRNINCRCPHVSCCKNQNLAEESLWIYGGILNLTHKKMFLLFGLSAKEYVLIIARIVFVCLIFIIFLMKWLYKVKEVTLFQVKCNKAESIYNNSHFFFFSSPPAKKTNISAWQYNSNCDSQMTKILNENIFLAAFSCK